MMEAGCDAEGALVRSWREGDECVRRQLRVVLAMAKSNWNFLGIPEYINRDEVLCIPASEFLIVYKFHVHRSAWSKALMLYAWYRGNSRKHSFSHPGARTQNIFGEL
jgi:hypothetical protein